MEKKIVLLPGDGIGPEIVFEAKRVLEEVGKIFGVTFQFTEEQIGGVAIDKSGVPLPDKTVEQCLNADAILLGAVGGPKWDNVEPSLRPERGLLKIRKALDLYANLRPVQVMEPLIHSSAIKPEILTGVDLLIVRELTGGIYFGSPSERREIDGELGVVDTLVYKRSEIKRILKQAFDFARLRSGRVMSVDKANVLESSRLWREVAEETANEYKDVILEHMLVDNAAMQLIRNPRQFDVIVTENLFGDILSDEASMISGSLGLLPSASMNSSKLGLFEPVHGSAPDIAGKGIANPLAAIASAAMLLQYGLGLIEEAKTIEVAIERALRNGYRTPDIALTGDRIVSTTEMTDAVIEALKIASYSN
ncbi:3-isopropylmalate dehydrogenase [Shouchella patagoniensis]|uniref:3-isopropylmalate dehydrogenase n=1 Tax=Shouchella patagoniensis TaxID=228576 RepID=UPI000994A020|nr:3-isopropylmalate dehydrogenase [Shouchella patagoniensis]